MTKAINITCPVNSLGYGRFSMNVLKSIPQDYHLAWWPIGQTEYEPQEQDLLARARNATAFFSIDAPSLRIWHPHDLSLHVGKGKKVGYTLFETTLRSKQELHQLAALDTLCVPSQWAKDRLIDQGGFSDSYIQVVPSGVDESFRPSPSFLPLDTSGPCTFLSIGKWEYRKGHDVLLTAFERAFRADDSVRLIMHCHNPVVPGGLEKLHAYNNSWVNYYKSSFLAEKIYISPNRFNSQREVIQLMQSAHCGVFLSRGEGWNMELLEMMACGKRTIATNYSAHTEYCTQENTHLIEIDSLEKAYDGVWFDGQQGLWAALGERQIQAAAEAMRAVYEDYKASKLTLQSVYLPARETARRFSLANIFSSLSRAIDG